MECQDCGTGVLVRVICDDCIDAEAAPAKAELRRERDEALDGKALLRVANANLLDELRKANERAEKAEAERDEARRERDEARSLQVRAVSRCGGAWWTVEAPGGLLLNKERKWVRFPFVLAEFPTEAEALAAGRALPWWPLQPWEVEA